MNMDDFRRPSDPGPSEIDRLFAPDTRLTAVDADGDSVVMRYVREDIHQKALESTRQSIAEIRRGVLRDLVQKFASLLSEISDPDEAP